MNSAIEKITSEIIPLHILTGADDFDSCRETLLAAARGFLETQLQRVQQLNEQGGSGCQIVKELTTTFDQLIDSLYRAVTVDLHEKEVASCAVIALGGYGRAEMNPRSDLDLMFFYEPFGKDAAQVISDRMLYLL